MSRLLELAKQAGLKKEHASDREYIGDFDWREFSELLIRECMKINRTQSYELLGVIIDTQSGGGFDAFSLSTVKRVHDYLTGNELINRIGLE